MIRRRLLGLAVFVAALALWELWARREASFLLPPISTVAERAAEVWPTDAFLSDVAASLRRLAVGYVLGATLAVAAGVVLGASARARRRSSRCSSSCARSRRSRSSRSRSWSSASVTRRRSP